MPKIVDKELIGDLYSETGLHSFIPFWQLTDQKLEENLIKFGGDDVFLTDLTTSKSITYNELSISVRRMAYALRKRGLGINGAVVMTSANRVELFVAYLAVYKASGFCVNLVLDLLPATVRSRMEENKAKFIVTDEERAAKVLEAVRDLDVTVFVIGRAEGCDSISDILSDPENDHSIEPVSVDLDSSAMHSYTSGTTGPQKCVVHTHRTLPAASFCASLGLSQDIYNEAVKGAKWLITYPMMGNTAVYGLAAGAINRASLYIFSNPTIDALLNGIDKIKPTMVSIRHSEIAEICRRSDTNLYDLSSVKMIVAGASCFLPSHEQDIYKKFPNLDNFINNYGMTETGALATAIPVLTSSKQLLSANIRRDEENFPKHVIGSCGKVYRLAKIKFVDENTGEKLGPGEVGELAAKTPYFMKEYLNRPKETTQLYHDGWLHTGDKGYYDIDGNIFIVGRFKELIKYRNTHVAPTVVENIMIGHPAVKDAAVVGQPHEIDGEHPIAFVVLEAGHDTTTAEELMKYTNERVSESEKLRGVHFIEHVPRNHMSKILRYELIKKLTQ